MDQACFLSRSVSHVNCVNCVFYNKKLNPETVSFQILKLMNFLPKFYLYYVFHFFSEGMKIELPRGDLHKELKLLSYVLSHCQALKMWG